MIRAAGYFRVSTKKEEQKQSLENQKELFLNFIKENDYVLYDFYYDSQTGTSAKRSNFIKMFEDAEKGLFDVIIIKDLSRLARNAELANKAKRITQEYNVRIISIDGLVDTFDEDKNKNFGLYAWLYQNESESISTRIKSIYKTKQKNGQFLGSLPPYGYNIVNKKLEPRNDYTADVISLIFKKYLDGWGQDKIARYLTELGHPTPAQLSGKSDAGQYWQGSSIKKILVNPHYIGHLVQYRETTFDAVNKKRKQIPLSEQIRVENTHTPLIDETTFNLVQQKIQSKKKNGRVKRYLDNRHLLTGMLYCADCGAPLWYRYDQEGYVCGTYAKHGKKKCTNHAIREALIIDIIKTDIKSFISFDLNKFNLDKKIADSQKRATKSITKLENQINNLNQKNKKYLDMLIDGLLDEVTYRRYIEMNKVEINSIQEELSSLIVQQEKKRPDIASIRSELVKIANLETLDRELLNMLIDRIEVKDTGELKVYYTFTSPVQEYNYKSLKSS